MSIFVYSTLANDNAYTVYHQLKIAGQLPQVKKRIIIKGKANLAHGGEYGLVTPLGKRTEVSEEDYEILKTIPMFQTHVQNGHISVQSEKKKADKVAKNMEKDISAPITPKDMEDANKEYANQAMPADFTSPEGKTVKGLKFKRQ